MRQAATATMLVLTFALFGASSARAELSITNGDFENGAGAFLTDVTDWYDFNGDGLAWWQQTSQDNTPAISPFPDDSSYLFLSGADGALGFWAYQSIGVNTSGASALPIAFDAGTLDDAGAILDRDITVALYQSDGSYAGGEDNVDIDGAAGVALVDSFTVSTGLLGPGELVKLGGTLDLGSDTTNEMYLRISNAVNNNPGADGTFHYVGIDNITIVPEPTSCVLLIAGLAGLGLARRFRRN